MHRILLLILFIALASSCSIGTPKHDIPVRTEYIDAGVEVGDTLDITTKDGEEKTIIVVEIGMDYIEGEEGRIAISTIEKIVKRSFTEPGHPCGANEPVGCSIPEVVLLLSDQYKEQATKFHPACVTHDFCYRHGYATYGVEREQCDTAFLADMKASCGGMKGIGLLDLEQYSLCRIAADQTHGIVRLKGEQHFRTTTSSVCEYDLSAP